MENILEPLKISSDGGFIISKEFKLKLKKDYEKIKEKLDSEQKILFEKLLNSPTYD